MAIHRKVLLVIMVIGVIATATTRIFFNKKNLSKNTSTLSNKGIDAPENVVNSSNEESQPLAIKKTIYEKDRAAKNTPSTSQMQIPDFNESDEIADNKSGR